MQIAFASGKGGSGKTTVSANLAAYLADQNYSVMLADCDVEEPNAHFFVSPIWNEEERSTVPVPEVDLEKCLGESCKSCVNLCRFRAIAWMGEVMTFPEMCHGCGLCFEACPAGALREGTRTIGTVSCGTSRLPSGNSLTVLSGRMRISEAMAPPLIKDVLSAERTLRTALPSSAQNDTAKIVTIRDCPPGTSCPMITSVEGADFVVLVTEPTPFGLHDAQLAAECLKGINIPFGVIINRHGIGDDRVERWVAEENIPLLGTLPYSTAAASACSEGKLMLHEVPDMEHRFSDIWQSLQSAMNNRNCGALRGSR